MTYIKVLKNGAKAKKLNNLDAVESKSISSLSYQVLDFKFTASLYAMMIIAFAAAAMHEKKRSYFKLGEH